VQVESPAAITCLVIIFRQYLPHLLGILLHCRVLMLFFIF